ncbi:MAG: DNA alkylation repair protein [Rhodothermaceae bacterium]|nr:DNA alkylation repair protein [Rhodothermaceae bacterium]
MDARERARQQLHVTPAYQRAHDHAQFDPASQGGARYWGKLPDGRHVPIERLEEEKQAYYAEQDRLEREARTAMTLDATLAQLEALGTEQNRTVYPRHGVKVPLFGVSFANLKALKKEIQTDHDLALRLWATGNHDARVFATMIADPAQAGESLLNAWAADLDNYILADSYSAYVGRTEHARTAMLRWIDDAREFVGQTGWNLLAGLALNDTDLPDSYFVPFLMRIERSIHDAQNRVRHAMNQAVIAIGTRSDGLEPKAVAAAERIGTVEVDHGATGCTTPEAAPYIQKARAHRRAKEAKASA